MANLTSTHLIKYLSNSIQYAYMVISVDNTIFPFSTFTKKR